MSVLLQRPNGFELESIKLAFDGTTKNGLITELGCLAAGALQVVVQCLAEKAWLVGAEALGGRRKLQSLEPHVLMRESAARFVMFVAGRY